VNIKIEKSARTLPVIYQKPTPKSWSPLRMVEVEHNSRVKIHPEMIATTKDWKMKGNISEYHGYQSNLRKRKENKIDNSLNFNFK
jgi:hypothetical protein